MRMTRLTTMTGFRTRVRRLVAACALAAACRRARADGRARAGAPARRRVGPGDRRTAAVLIEATEPVAYAVSRPDPLTRARRPAQRHRRRCRRIRSRAADRSPASRSSRRPPIDGKALARVRVALASPADLQGAQRAQHDSPRARAATAARPDDGTPAAVQPRATAPAATRRQRRSDARRSARDASSRRSARPHAHGDDDHAGRQRPADPASLTESDDQPRRLVLDFPERLVEGAGADQRRQRVREAGARRARQPRAARHARRDGDLADGDVSRRAEPAPTAATSRSCSRAASPAADAGRAADGSATPAAGGQRKTRYPDGAGASPTPRRSRRRIR